MKKTLFLTCALALASFVGVSAQTWCRTLAQGTAGEQITHDVNGTSVTQYRAETALIKNEGATGVRYTVMQTGALNQIKGGGPCFALGELQVFDADGNQINYTVTSNADHNTMGGAGNDGAGMPALNDGNLANYFHSTWSSNAPNEYHYLELSFEESVDAFKLVWYTRPNQHQNRPLIIGLTNPGVDFTEDMLYAEYEYSLGAKVADASELAGENKFFTFYVEGPESYGADDEGNPYTGPGNVYVALSGYTTGSATVASPTNIIQLIAGNEGKYVIYQPVLGTYYGNPDQWTDGYNGTNGWQRAYAEAWTLGEYEFTQRADGDFELTTYATRQYVDGAWQEYENPLKLWIGYDMRGNLKLFPKSLKEALEAGDYTKGFALPVDFGFSIYNANVADGLIEPVSVTSICENVINPTIAQAREKMEEYAQYEADYGDGEREALEEAIEAAEEAIEASDIAGIFVAKDEVAEALVQYVLIKVLYYEDMLGELEEAYEANNGTEEGNYTAVSKAYIDAFEAAVAAIYDMTSVSAIENAYANLEAIAAQFYASTLKFMSFPCVVDSISNATTTDYPNNAVWTQQVALKKAIEGIRITPLSVYIGSAGGGGLYGSYPMVALGEIKVYDGQGNEVSLDETMVYASATETNEGFESTAARLVDGAITGAGSYFHSPWSGTQPSEYVYIEITFPEAMDMFTLEVYSRDKSTTGGNVSLFPFRAALTNLSQKYDPQLFAENPYNVFVGEQIKSVEEFTEGIYVIRGLLNTNPVYKYDAETGAVVKEESAAGEAKYYHGVGRYHANPAAVRADGVYRVTKNADGTFKMLNLGLAKYWPSTEGTADERTGAITATYSEAKAANLKIVASENLENTFVLYEEVPGLVTTFSEDTDEDGEADTVVATHETPYVVYMDWSTGVATRPVTALQPLVDESISDTWGDSLCFNKANGEGEWEIYKVDMDNADYFWLTNLVGIVDGLGVEVGPDPGCVASLGDLQGAYDAAVACIDAQDYAGATAVAQALAAKIELVEGLEKNPMKEGVYIIQSAYSEYYKQQGHYKAMYASEDGTTLGWKQLTTTGNVWADNEFYFEFTKSPYASDYDEEIASEIYNIRAVKCGGDAPMYISEVDGLSTQIALSDYESDYYVKAATGSAFNLKLASASSDWCLHSNGHSNGAGTSGNLVYWYGDPGASQWRLVWVGEVGTSVSDLLVEGSEVASVAYFTPAGAAIPAPAKGINVVVTVYANGVVETKKVLVK